MVWFPDRRNEFRRPVRIVARLVVALFLYHQVGYPAFVQAQTFRGFRESAGSNLERYVDRAERLENEEDWSNYVQLGISTERVEWEQEAYEQLQTSLEEIEAGQKDEEEKEEESRAVLAEFEAARTAWEEEAAEAYLEERGRYRARQAAVEVAEVDTAEYESLIAAAQAAVSGVLTVELEAWESAIAAPHADLRRAFEDSLGAELDRARTENAGLGEIEQAAFEAELARTEEKIRREFQVRDNFYLVRARNRYIALKRNDDLNAKLDSEKSGAAAVGEEIIAETTAELALETENRLKAAVAETEQALEGATNADFEGIGNNWETQIENTISAGLRRWERAEEDLYARRLTWLEETRRTREEGDKIWKENHEKLKNARDEWIRQVERQIEEGRAEWRGKFEEFDRNRIKAERELAEYITTERERWDASSGELADMISGGGAALLEAKDAVRYYQSSLDLIGTPTDGRERELETFYKNERDYMAAAVGRFQTILAQTEGVLHAKMHSGESYTGILRDARLFAGDLPDTIAALDETDFKANLREKMSSRGEDFLLYRRDIESLIERNELFVSRVGDLAASTQFDYAATADLAALTEMVEKIDRKYEAHRAELTEILNAEREGLDEDEKLAAIKEGIADWVTGSGDENKRLKRKTLAYFRDGLGGTYLTRNESDPYLLTRAEYEWELLRRERNYLAKNLRRAEAVKEYADLAFQHEAGLETKAVTAERARVAKVHRDLLEINYMLIRGDIVLDPEVYTDEAKRDLFFEEEILKPRGIFEHQLLRRKASLDTEIDNLDGVLAADVPDAAATLAMIDALDAYLTGVPEEGRENHSLSIVRAKLIGYRNRATAGAGAAELADRWKALQGATRVLQDELSALRDEYDFPALADLLVKTRDGVTRKNLVMLRAEVAGKKGEIEANARLLAEAKKELERAKDAYRQARIDFDVLRAANSEDLIRIDITNTTQSLAGVLHRMEKIEGLEGFQERLLDPVTKGQIEYIHEISRNEQAKQDRAYSKDILVELEGLEEAKKREAALTRLLAEEDLNSLPPEDAAQYLIDRENELIDRDAAEPFLRSHDSAVQLMDALKSSKTALSKSRDELSRAVADGRAADEIELLRMRVGSGRESIFRDVELLIGTIRGEERARRDAVLFLLGEKDASGEPLPEAVRAESEAGTEATGKIAFEIAESGARRITDFMSAHRESSFAELLKTVNERIAALPRAINTNLVSYRSNTDDYSRERAEWNLVRAWIFENRALVEVAGAAPDENDDRSVSEKWNLLLDAAADASDDAKFYRTFEDGIPDGADHAWVAAFKAERGALLGRLEDVLASGDPAGAYRAMSAEDRDLITRRYGAFDYSNARRSLENARKALRVDVEGADRNFRALFLSETSERNKRILERTGAELRRLQGELTGALAESARLKKDRAGAEPARQAAMDARLARLAVRIARLEPEVERLEDEFRASTRVLKEIQNPGSNSSLVSYASAELYQRSHEANLQQWGRSLMNLARNKKRETREVSATDQVKAIIGFFRTDRQGTIQRDAAGKALVSQEFIDMGLDDPSVDLAEVLSGSQKGPDLLRWAERLTAFHADQRNREKSTPEVSAAVNLLERYIRELIAAREIINHRHDSAASLEASSKDEARRMETLLKKLGQFQSLEQQLSEAVVQATQSREEAARRAQMGQEPGPQLDPVDAALGVLERQENIGLLYLLDGYDETGAPDGVRDAAGQDRVDELKQLARRLRAIRTNRILAEVAGGYAEIQGQYRNAAAANPYAAPPSLPDYLASKPALQGAAILGEVRALDENGFREKLFEMLQSPPADSSLFIGEIMGALSESPEDGAGMKAGVIDALKSYQARIDAELTERFAALQLETDRLQDLRVTRGIEELMKAYAVRGTKAKSLLPELAALNDADSVEDARGRIASKIDELLGGAELSSNRTRLYDALNKAATTAEIKTSLSDYLNGLVDPGASEMAVLGEEVKVRELHRSIVAADSSFAYRAEDYPTELREFVLVRGFSRARERYERYRRLRISDVAAERESAVLDLTGLGGDFANHILVADFNAFVGEMRPEDFIAGGDGRRSLGEYLGAFFRDRNTAPGVLPGGGGAILEQAALSEYRRIRSDAAGNPAGLDERDYFADFRSFLLVAKAEDYIAANGIVLRGANAGEIRGNFRADFEAMLDDASYSTPDGETLRQRLLSDDAIEGFLNMAQAFLAYRDAGGSADGYLPDVLAERRIEARLDEPSPVADDYLPDELKAISGYATADYRALAHAADPAFGAALASLEVDRAAAGEDLGVSLDDARLNQIIDRAGHGAASGAVRDGLLSLLRARNKIAQANGADSAEGAVRALRANRVLAHVPGAGEDLEVFAAAFRKTTRAVEESFFGELEASHADLRVAAKEQRGRFLRALIERSRGVQTDYYNSLPPGSRTKLDGLAARFMGKLGGAHQNDLLDNAADFERLFDLRSGQELVASGLFERTENAVFAVLARSAPENELNLARENRNAVLRAFIEQSYVNRGLQASLGPRSAAFLNAAPGLADHIRKAALDADPMLGDTLADERVLVERFLDHFQETDAERRELESIYNDPGVLNPAARLSLNYEHQKEAILRTEDSRAVTAALEQTVADHGRYFSGLATTYARQQSLAEDLAEFAGLRGDDPNYKSSRFSSYRTYIGGERKYQLKDYENYLKDRQYRIEQNPDEEPDYLKSFDEFQSGMVLHAESLNQDDPEALLNQANFEDLLLSDANTSADPIELGKDTELNHDDRKVAYRVVNTVSSNAKRGTLYGDDYNAEIRHTYFENLANNYLEASTRLNSALNAVWLAAGMADTRSAAETPDEFIQKIKDNYDPAGAYGAGDLEKIRELKLEAESRLADHSEAKINTLQNSIQGIQDGFDKAALEYAGASRRNQLSTMELVDFLRTNFYKIDDEFKAAEARVDTLAANADRLRDENAVIQRAHVDGMNRMAAYFRDYTAADEELETRQAVQEYAETPYLFAASADADSDTFADSLEEYRGDAREEYQRALSLYEQGQARLKEASFAVETQDSLTDFHAIVAGLDGGVAYPPLTEDERKEYLQLQDKKFRDYDTLTGDEEARLVDLRLREMRDRYSDVIRTRADHIKHTMRMTRIHKASEIVNAEIQRRRVIAEEKKRRFEQALARNFGPGDAADQKEARDIVYKRLLGIVEDNEPDARMALYNEYRSWYWGTPQWAEDVGGSVESTIKNGQFNNLPQITISQIAEGANGLGSINQVPREDRDAIATWQAKEGNLDEFNQFRGVYFAFMNQLAQADMARMEAVITTTTFTPVAAIGATMAAAGGVMVGVGMGMFSIGTGLIAAIITAAAGVPLLGLGLSMTATGLISVAAGMALTLGSLTMILQANLKAAAQQMNAWVMQSAAIASAGEQSVRNVQAKQKEYQEAQAALEYFTKVPDQKTMKERMIQWGLQHDDDPNDNSGEKLYRLTDEDLVYLMERDGQGEAFFENSAGARLDPTAEERREALDITANKRTTEYLDAFGKRYNPDESRMLDYKPGNLVAGVYKGAAGDYVRINVGRPDGTSAVRYALVEPESAPDRRAYNMGEIFDKLVVHGTGLQNQRRQAYIAASNARGDETFGLKERDQTFENLFNQAAGHREGGREFSGYRVTYEDYVKNAKGAFEVEIDQRQSLQKKEWDLRAQELQDRYNSWEKRIQTVLERGRKSWAGSEDRFLQKWRNWERELDQDVAAAHKTWDERIKKHFQDKQNWELDVRAKASERSVEETLGSALDQLNAQIGAAEANLGTTLVRKNKLAVITETIADMRRSMPGKAERLKALNKSIKTFSTRLSIGASVRGDFARDQVKLAATYRSEQNGEEGFKKHMGVLKNVKMYEQYRRMVSDFILSMEDQNQAIENQTTQAALSAGYLRVGDRFIKTGTSSRSYGAVDAYTWFDTKAAVENAMTEAGFSQLGEGTLARFLKDKSNIEVEGYFYTQRLALQTVFEKIRGRGNQAERADSRDAAVIGQFGLWAGKGPDGEKAKYATMAAGNSFASRAQGRNQFIQNFAYGGFGELGSTGERPGGAPLGFYPQLNIMSDHVRQQDSAGIASAGANDPLTQAFNSINPFMIVANTVNQVRIRTEVHGESKGKVHKSEGIKFTKSMTKAVATAVITAASFGTATYAAMAAMAAAESLNEDGSFSMNSQKAVSLAASIGGALIGGSELAGFTKFAMNQAVTAAAGGFNFDERGRVKGNWSLEGRRGDRYLTGLASGIVGGGLGKVFGGGALANAMGNSFVSNSRAYAQCKSGNAAACVRMSRGPGLEGITSLLSINGTIKEWGEGVTNSIGITKELERELNNRHADDANRNDQNNRYADILKSVALNNRRDRGIFGNFLVGAAEHMGLGEHMGNWLEDGGEFISNKELAGKKFSQAANRAVHKTNEFLKSPKVGGREYVKQLNKHIAELKAFGVDTNKLEARAAFIESKLEQTEALRARLQQTRRRRAPIRRSRPMRRSRSTPTQYVPGKTGRGNFRIIRDWGIRGGGGAADSVLGYFGIKSNVRGYLRGKYDQSKTAQRIDDKVTGVYHDAVELPGKIKAGAGKYIQKLRGKITGEIDVLERDIRRGINTVKEFAVEKYNQGVKLAGQAYDGVTNKANAYADWMYRKEAEILTSTTPTRWLADKLIPYSDSERERRIYREVRERGAPTVDERIGVKIRNWLYGNDDANSDRAVDMQEVGDQFYSWRKDHAPAGYDLENQFNKFLEEKGMKGFSALRNRSGILTMERTRGGFVSGIFGTKTVERFEVLKDGRVNAVFYDGGLRKHLLGADDTYINGVKLEDGDGIYRDPVNKLSVKGQKGMLQFLRNLELGPKDRMLFTQNGVMNHGLNALDLNNTVRHTVIPDIEKLGNNFKGSMSVYNRSHFLVNDGLDLLKSLFLQSRGLPGTEPSQHTWSDILHSGALEHGGLVAAHSQGAQIVTHAFELYGKDTKASLVTMGGAHTVKPKNVESMYDLRNKPDRVTSLFHEQLGDGINPVNIFEQPHYEKHFQKGSNFRENWRVRDPLKMDIHDAIRGREKQANWYLFDPGLQQHDNRSYADGMRYLMERKGVNFLR